MDAIETNRLVLRNFRSGDALGIYAYLKEPGASCFLSMKLDDMGAAEAMVENRSRSDDHIAVCLKDSGEVIGDVFAVPEEDTFAVGWNFNGDFSGCGFASEAARALFSYLFSVRGARRLYAYVEDHNRASRRLCERLGMRQEGLFLEYVAFKKDDSGEPIFENTVQFAILRKEWLQSGER
ncbi:GNAT family N-acetyltransferase [Phyllobacterium phragmitis]|uniref:GNAT family N-acetyltransferase n=1 Tax=Phyllobacterium phragmitis TaxID=2670329 RepID=A0A2S9ISX1_9HYPH|nr:GNAT family N-acetyltransferase [Phyllobacterium phragmitis]PRD43626.1 GNAT family N-acetyltransferase [Phyllobacterium phragmitis]